MVKGLYRHFKGGIYEVIGTAKHTETGETMVVYKSWYNDCEVYVRPIEMFNSKVDTDKYPEADQEYRFQLIKKK